MNSPSSQERKRRTTPNCKHAQASSGLMSLLSICQEVAAEIPVAPPVGIIGNPDGTAQLMLALAQRAGEALARRPPGGWVAMIREYDFATAAVSTFSGSVANLGPAGVAIISGATPAAISAVTPNAWVAFGTGLKITPSLPQ